MLPFLHTVSLVVIVCISVVYGATCGTYTATDGTLYDLTLLTKPQNIGYFINIGSYTYYFNLCDNYITAQTTTYCYAVAPVYQISTTNLCYLLGTLPPTIKDGINGPDTGVTIVYTNQEDRCQFGTLPRIVNINIACDPKAKTETVVSLTEPAVCVYDIAMTSPVACPKVPTKSSSGMAISGGTLFLILLLIIVVLYIVGGVIFRYKFREVEPGLGLLPHLGFWTVIPGLVKDGFIFTFDKIRGIRGN